MKKENDALKNKFELVLNEKNELSKFFEKMKIDFEKYETSCKDKSPITTCNKNEFLEIQKRIEVLDITLKKCAFDMTKFASIFLKENPKRNILIIMHLTHTNMHTRTSLRLCIVKFIYVHIVAAKAI